MTPQRMHRKLEIDKVNSSVYLNGYGDQVR